MNGEICILRHDDRTDSARTPARTSPGFRWRKPRWSGENPELTASLAIAERVADLVDETLR